MTKKPKKQNKPVEGEILPAKDELGRPTILTEDVVKKLEEAFSNDFNVTQACQHANISRVTYYDWYNNNLVFSNRMDVARTALGRAAKGNVVKAINDGDPNVSLKYLTLRDPDYKPKAAMDVTNAYDETKNKIRGFLDDPDDDAGKSSPTTKPEDGSQVAGTTEPIS